MRRFLPYTLLAVAGLLISDSRARGGSTSTATQAERDLIIHVLNRTTFGLRPGDVEAVQKIGLQKYIQQQLHPETIDDSAVEKQLAQFNLLQLDQTDLHQLFYGERHMEAARRKEKINQTATPAPGEDKAAKQDGRLAKAMGDIEPTELMKENGSYISAVSELQHAKLLRAVDSQRQLQEVLVDFWGNHFNVDIKKKGPICVYKITDDREVIRPHIFGTFREMLGASAKSPAMLMYLDNAKNSVDPTGNNKREMAPLTMAVTGTAAGVVTPPAKAKRNRGINENYAREIMELHTLGVDGGYTQKDVQEVARCFTGWTIDQATGLFVFRPRLHDEGAKVVLGHMIPANGGEKDGEMVLDILASQPACAQFIAREMCERFVGDKPPQKLVDRVAGEFTATKGDLRAVTAAILTSPEFLDPATYGNKIKSPMEFAVSAVRASNSSFIEARKFGPGNKHRDMESAAIMGKATAADRYMGTPQQSLNWHVYTLGEPLFACTPPTGYSEVSSRWVSPGALIERLNFAMALTEQRISDVRFSANNVLGTADIDQPDEVLKQCIASLLQSRISDQTKAVLTEAALPKKDTTVNPNKLIALIIGSPEFQRK